MSGLQFWKYAAGLGGNGRGVAVRILEPATKATLPEDTAVTFTATAEDADGVNIAPSLVWTSDVDGLLGNGATFSATPTNGKHKITATATDSEGRTGRARITIRLSTGENPVVTITSPTELTVVEGNEVVFTGSAFDDWNGDLTSQLSWDSDLDNQIGTGGTFTSDILSVGTNTVTAAVTDSDGDTGTAQVVLTVREPGFLEAPVLFLGDSRTAGNLPGYPNYDSGSNNYYDYVSFLGLDGTNNKAVPGETLELLQPKVTDYLANNAEKLVVLGSGVGDLRVGAFSPITVSQALTDMILIINEILADGRTLLVMPVLPYYSALSNNLDGIQDKIDQFNAGTADYIAQLGNSKCSYAYEVYEGFLDPSFPRAPNDAARAADYVADGLHYSAAGAQRLAGLMLVQMANPVNTHPEYEAGSDVVAEYSGLNTTEELGIRSFIQRQESIGIYELIDDGMILSLQSSYESLKHIKGVGSDGTQYLMTHTAGLGYIGDDAGFINTNLTRSDYTNRSGTTPFWNAVKITNVTTAALNNEKQYYISNSFQDVNFAVQIDGIYSQTKVGAPGADYYMRAAKESAANAIAIIQMGTGDDKAAFEAALETDLLISGIRGEYVDFPTARNRYAIFGEITHDDNIAEDAWYPPNAIVPMNRPLYINSQNKSTGRVANAAGTAATYQLVFTGSGEPTSAQFETLNHLSKRLIRQLSDA